MVAPLLKPFTSVPLLDHGHDMLVGQLYWWLCNEPSGLRVNNLMSPTVGEMAGSFKSIFGTASGFVRGRTGNELKLDSPGYISLDDGLSTQLALANTEPFTYAWMDIGVSSVNTFQTSACFTSGLTSNRWLIQREDSNATYRYLFCGKASGSNDAIWSNAPSLAASVGVPRMWVITGPSGMDSLTNYQLWVDGVKLGAPTGSVAFGNQAATSGNYLGFDPSGGSSYTGNISNCRLWRRVLADSEIRRLFADPYAGLQRPARIRIGSTATATARHRMLLAM